MGLSRPYFPCVGPARACTRHVSAHCQSAVLSCRLAGSTKPSCLCPQVDMCPRRQGRSSLHPRLSSCFPSRRFLNSLGSIFSFVSKDVVMKLQIMERLCSSPQREHYRSLQSMVAYEMGNQLVDLDRRSRHPDSGCRTMLRLHRALRWLQLFLESLRTSPEDARTATLCTDSYNASLAAYHPWIDPESKVSSYFSFFLSSII